MKLITFMSFLLIQVFNPSLVMASSWSADSIVNPQFPAQQHSHFIVASNEADSGASSNSSGQEEEEEEPDCD